MISGYSSAIKNGVSGFRVVKIPLIEIQPIASSTRKIDPISPAPRVKPNPKSVHQSRFNWKPKLAKFLRSSNLPASQILSIRATPELRIAAVDSQGLLFIRSSILEGNIVSPGWKSPRKVARAMLTTTRISWNPTSKIMLSNPCPSRRQRARGRFSWLFQKICLMKFRWFSFRILSG